MQEKGYSLAGSVVFWSLGDETDHALLAEGLAECGLASYLPERMTPYASLREALETMFSSSQIVPVATASNTFEVIKIEGDEDSPEARNKYVRLVTAAVDDNEIVTSDASAVVNSMIQDEYNQNRRTIAHGGVTTCLVKIVHCLGGVALRANGGVYWVPHSRWPQWEQAVKVIEQSGPRNYVHALRTIYDSHSVTAIRAALTTEISREAKRIDEAVHGADATERSVSVAVDRAQMLQQKITSYEQDFGIIMSDLQDMLRQAMTIQAHANLMSAMSINETEE